MRTLYEGGTFFEGPRWHDGRWYVSDFYTQSLLSVDPDTGAAEVHAEVPAQPSGSGWLPDGTMLIVSMKDQRILRRADDGTLSTHADLSSIARNNLNDMAVSARGDAYVGEFGFDIMFGGDPERGRLFRITPEGEVSVAAEDLMFPNGGTISKDGGTLVISESFGTRMTAFDIAGDGSLENQRVWAKLGEPPAWDSLATMVDTPFAPDGNCFDSEGCVWVADALNSRASRVAEGGEIVDEVKAPEGHGLYACQLGGPDGKTLLACCAPSFLESERVDKTEAILVAYDVEVPR